MLRIVPCFLCAVALLGQTPVVPEARQFAATVMAAPDAAARAALYQRMAPLTPQQVYVALNALADAAHRKGEHDRELELARIELEFAQFSRDGAVLVQAHRDIGLAFEDMAQLDAAAKGFLAALAVAPPGDNELQAMLSYTLGQTYRPQREFRKALASLERSLAISERINNARGIAYTCNAIGAIYYDQRDAEMATAYHRRSLEVKQKARMTRDLSTTLNNLALDYTLTGQIKEAQASLEQAMRYAEPGTQNALTVIYNAGFLLAGQEHFTAAIGKFRESLAIARKLGAGDLELEALASIGQSQFEIGDDDEACQTLSEAVRRMAEMGGTAHNLRVQVYYATALLRKNERLKEAESELLQSAAELEENESQLVGGVREQALFVDGSVDPYRPLTDLYVAQGKTEQALAAAERGRAHKLLEAMGNRSGSITGSMSAEEKKQERELAHRLVIAGNQTRAARGLGRSSNSESLASLEKARAEYRVFLSGLYLRHPELSIARGLPATLTRERLAALVDNPHTALLEYVIDDRQSHLFVARRGSSGALTLHVVPIRFERGKLDRRVQKFYELMAGRNLDYRTQSRALHHLLLETAAAELAGITSLVIVPDGSLWQLPFAALLGPNSHPVGEDFSLSFAPSLVALGAMTDLQHQRGTSRRTLLALGNPQGLPDAEREVRAVEQVYGKSHSAVYIGAAAREEVFKSQAGNYDVIHTATHGLFNNRGPMYSRIELAKPEKSDTEDGMLEAWELLGMKLKADLAVLSACESGRGQPGAEGLVGMTWALFVAGVPSVVAGRWKVDSAATSEFMIAFHRELKRTGNKAVALRLAALHIKSIAAWRHPAYWAAFMLVGSTR